MEVLHSNKTQWIDLNLFSMAAILGITKPEVSALVFALKIKPERREASSVEGEIFRMQCGEKGYTLEHLSRLAAVKGYDQKDFATYKALIKFIRIKRESIQLVSMSTVFSPKKLRATANEMYTNKEITWAQWDNIQMLANKLEKNSSFLSQVQSILNAKIC